MPSNAEHIASLQRISIQHPGCTKAIAAAIHALKTEGRSPWRKVGKRHPGTKWVGEAVLTEWSCGRRTIEDMPAEGSGLWAWWLTYAVRWMPWPEHPEKGKVKSTTAPKKGGLCDQKDQIPTGGECQADEPADRDILLGQGRSPRTA